MPMRNLVVLSAVLLLSACSSQPRQSPPAPVVSHGSPADAQADPQVRAYRLPEQTSPQVAAARPQPSRAVQVLMRRADDQRRAGDYAAAAASIERGLRIDPQNARLWNRLAHVRASQQQFDQVEQFAGKSNALAGGDEALVADNWQLIAQARAARGDSRGAAEARRRATLVR